VRPTSCALPPPQPPPHDAEEGEPEEAEVAEEDGAAEAAEEDDRRRLPSREVFSIRKFSIDRARLRQSKNDSFVSGAFLVLSFCERTRVQ
jgi:hypothetical protein